MLCVADDRDECLRQVGAALATGNRALVPSGGLDGLPPLSPALAGWVAETAEWRDASVAAILFSGDPAALAGLNRMAAALEGPIVPVHVAGADGRYPLEWLVRERVVSTNTTAAGGNATLMMIG